MRIIVFNISTKTLVTEVQMLATNVIVSVQYLSVLNSFLKAMSFYYNCGMNIDTLHVHYTR